MRPFQTKRHQGGRRLHLQRTLPSPRDVRLDLKTLQRWADGLAVVDLPSPENAPSYWNFKLPISAGTAALAPRKPEIERRILKALLQGAEHLADHPAGKNYGYFRAAALVSPHPNYFYSEVTAFFDPDYYARFCYRADQSSLPMEASPLIKAKLDLPDGFQASGCRFQAKDEDGQPWTEEHWTFGPLP